MGEKTAGVGHFTIPTAPAAGTSCTSGAANVFTTTYVQLIASTAAALYITGVHLEAAAAMAATYIVVQLATGGAGSETIVGQYLVPLSTGSTVALGYRPIYPPIPVGNATRIACKTADSVGAKATLVTLECIAQSNVVDDGVAVGTVTTVTNQLTAAAIAAGVWQDAVAGDFTVASSVGKALYIANVAPGAAGGHMISGANAGTTTLGALTVTGAITGNITGNLSGSVGSVTGAVGSVTAAVVLPAIPANWITAAGITAAALNGKGDWNIGKTGYSLTQTFPANFASLSITAAGLADITQAAADKVWSTAARILTAGTNIVLAKGVGVTGFNDLDAAAMRTAVGLASANLDTQLSAINTAVGTRLATAGYTAPDNAGVAAIKAKTDSLTFTVAGKADSNIAAVNGIAVTGSGTAGSPWSP